MFVQHCTGYVHVLLYFKLLCILKKLQVHVQLKKRVIFMFIQQVIA